MKTVVFVLCQDDVYHGGQKSINSIKYFHPEFKIIRYGTEDINRIKNQYNCPDIRFIYPLALKEVWENEKPDLLIRLGADCLVLGNLDEVIHSDYDVAAARNDPDCVGNRDESNNRPDRIRDIPNHEWVNADFIAIKNYEFVEQYFQQTLDYWEGRDLCLANQPYHDKYGRLLYRTYKGDCQSSLNVVFKLGGLKTLILDPLGSKLVYGASGNWNGENATGEIPESAKGNGANCWPAWKYIYYDEKLNKCILPDKRIGIGDRIVKNLHQGGGYWDTKLGFDLFNSEFRKYLTKITGYGK